MLTLPPVSLFSKPFSELYENNMLIIEDYKIGPTFGLGSIGNQLNNKSSYIFALKNLNGHFLGTLGKNISEGFCAKPGSFVFSIYDFGGFLAFSTAAK